MKQRNMERPRLKCFLGDGRGIRVHHKQVPKVEIKGYSPSAFVSRKVNLYRLRFVRNNLFRAGSLVDAVNAKAVGGVKPAESGPVQTFSSLDKLLKEFEERVLAENARHVVQRFLKRHGCDDCPTDKLNVFRFLRAWMLHFLPRSLLGGVKNRDKFLRNLKALMGGGKMCTLQLGAVMRNIDLDQMSWLQESSDITARQRVAAKLMLWLTEDVIWRLLTSHFHVTDTSFGRHELFFYPRRHWQALYDRAVSRLHRQKSLVALSVNKAALIAAKEGAPDIARARLLPKRMRNSCRIIGVKKAVRNQVEANTQIVLGKLKAIHREIVDNRGKALHETWRNFVERLDGGNPRPIFFARTDIQDAFDSVNLSKLSQIVRCHAAKFSNKEYLHTAVFRNNAGRILRRHHLSYSSEYSWMGKKSSGLILVNATSQKLEVNSLMNRLARRSSLHVLQFEIAGKIKRFLKTNGLVQGDCLSSGLCDLYYGDMVDKKLVPELRKAKEKGALRFFVRGVDDFIYVSTSQSEVERFLSLMEAGFPSYGVKIQRKKTSSNLPSFTEETTTEIPFCGALLNVCTLQVKPDFSTYVNKSIVHSMKFYMGKEPNVEKFIKHKILFTSVFKLDPLYLDPSFNKRATILENLFESFYVCALRFDAMVDSLLFASGKDVSSDFVLSCMDSCLKEKVLRRVKRASSSAVPANETAWLFRRAFYTVLLKKASKYGRDCCTEVKKRCCLRFARTDARAELLRATKVISDRQTSKIRSRGYQRF